MIEQKNGEQVFEYKFPEFLNDNNEISTKSDDYEILQVLGAGAFSCVLKVKSKINKQIYAMKKVDMQKILEEMGVDRKYFENEIHFLQNLRSNFVCKCYTIFQEENFLFFIMEFMNNGDLLTFYKANKALQKQIPEDKMWDIFYKSISGLKYIHEKGLIHRDIKLENLFLDDNFNIKIGDFNVSATIDSQAAQNFADDQGELENMVSSQTVVGTAGYMAPEVKRNEKMDSMYGPKADVFSMGVSFFELCYGDKPYQRVNKNQYYQKKLYSPELNKIVDQMIEKDDRKRPTSEESFYFIKKNFINKYVKNSSVDATLNCFYQFPNFREFFLNNNNKRLFLNNQTNTEQGDNNEIDQVNHKVEIGNSIFDVIQSLNSNNKDVIDDRMYELRNSMTNAGLNAKENEEIDPGLFISFFLRILNSVLNEILVVDENSFNKEDLMILSSTFKFNKGQEEGIFNSFLNAYNKKLLSLISRNFFNIIKIKKECKNPGCNNVGYSFSMFNFIPFNVDILTHQSQKKDNLHLKDGFNCLLNDSINLDKSKGIFCNICKDYTVHHETKTFYHTAKDLVIIFDRGEDFSNKTFINFDEQLVLNQKEVERYKEVSYNLVSVLVKLETNKGNDEFVCFMNYGNNNWVSNKNKQNSVNLDEVKKSGIIAALFYYSNDNNLILQSQVSQYMNNQPNNYQNNNMYGNQGMQNNFPGNGTQYGNNGNGFNNNGPNYPNNNCNFNGNNFQNNNGTNYPNYPNNNGNYNGNNNGYNNGNYNGNNFQNNNGNYNGNNNGYNNGNYNGNNNGYNNGNNFQNNNGPNYPNNNGNYNGNNFQNNNGNFNGNNFQNNNGNYNGNNYPNNNGYNNGNNYQNNNGPNYPNNNGNYNRNNFQNNNGNFNGNNYQNNNGYNNGNNYQNNNGFNNGNNYPNNNGYNNGNNFQNNNGYNNGNNNNGYNNMSMNNMPNSSIYMSNNNMTNSNNNIRNSNMGMNNMNNPNTNIGFNNNNMNMNMNNSNNNIPINNNNMGMNNNNMNNSYNNVPMNNNNMGMNNNNMANSNNNVSNSINMSSNMYGMGNNINNSNYGPAPSTLTNIQNNNNQNYRNN